MVGIIGATDFEMKELLESELEISEKKEIGGYTFYEGTLFGKSVVASKCGIGKVFAACCAQTMLMNFDVDYILNCGAAGGLIPQLHRGDAVICEKAVQYDMDTTAFGDPLGLISGINVVKLPVEVNSSLADMLKGEGIGCSIGECATADRFCTRDDVKELLKTHFGCSCVDMECGALAQICYVNGAKLESIKIISDGADSQSADEYDEYTGSVGKRVCDILKIRLTKC